MNNNILEATERFLINELAARNSKEFLKWFNFEDETPRLDFNPNTVFIDPSLNKRKHTINKRKNTIKLKLPPKKKRK